jgi:hypothetical protein
MLKNRTLVIEGINNGAGTFKNEEFFEDYDVEDDTTINEAKITPKGSLQLLNRLKSFCLDDAVLLSLACQIPSNLRKL